MYAMGKFTEQTVKEANVVLGALREGKDIISVNGVTICDATSLAIEVKSVDDDRYGLLDIGQKGGTTCTLTSFKGLFAEVFDTGEHSILSIKTATDDNDDACSAVALERPDPAEVDAVEHTLNLMLNMADEVKVGSVCLCGIKHIEIAESGQCEEMTLKNYRNEDGDFAVITLDARKHEVLAWVRYGKLKNVLYVDIYAKNELEGKGK